MTANEIRNRISELCSHFLFIYRNKECGVDPYNSTDFDLWCGEDTVTVKSIDEVMNKKFFDGMSLNEISDEITIVVQ